MPKTFHMLTLGCPKNRVDAEVIWAAAAEKGLAAVDDPAQAEIIIVNTCAFIESAVTESLDKILELGTHKQYGRCNTLVVAGCLPARYGKELADELPEVDLFVGPGEVANLAAYLSGAERPDRFSCQPGKAFLGRADIPRANSLSAGAAYLKIAEGCSRQCSFCIIPKIRGPQQSRPVEDLVREAESLIGLGVKEIVLVAQDLMAYGTDLDGKPGLADLVQALAGLTGLRWLRLMYLFPHHVPDRLIRVMAEHDTVLPYLDLPFQHADPLVLEKMRRGGDPRTNQALVDRLRAELPGVVLRTSLMTGFPGETAAAFVTLTKFVERCRFERLGVFAFSPEASSPAHKYADQVPGHIADQRKDTLMSRQQEIARAYHDSLIGTTLEVLVEERSPDGRLIGRAWNQAPEVDGQTVITGLAEPGQIVKARVTKADPYDLEAEIVE